MNVHLVIVTALEALETGDTGYAVDVLLQALEDGPTDHPHPCRLGCPAAFEWPGLRDEHEDRCTAKAAA